VDSLVTSSRSEIGPTVITLEFTLPSWCGTGRTEKGSCNVLRKIEMRGATASLLISRLLDDFAASMTRI